MTNSCGRRDRLCHIPWIADISLANNKNVPTTLGCSHLTIGHFVRVVLSGPWRWTDIRWHQREAADSQLWATAFSVRAPSDFLLWNHCCVTSHHGAAHRTRSAAPQFSQSNRCSLAASVVIIGANSLLYHTLRKEVPLKMTVKGIGVTWYASSPPLGKWHGPDVHYTLKAIENVQNVMTSWRI